MEIGESGALSQSGSGPPIGDLDPSTEVVGTHRGRRRSRWRGRGRRLAAPTQNQSRISNRRFSIDSRLGSPNSDLDPDPAGTHGGRRPPRWRGRGCRLAALTPNLPRTSDSESSVGSGLGPPIGDPDSSTEVAGVLRGYRQPRWRSRGCRLAASTPFSLLIFFI
ncbi:hypothetical protein CRG98_014325 [Punica granatum]|uniref:Uncharacterized protein n=1 Tax=Punica granatum TaxID=22663 RepID=A0A2I0K9R9_PUNGR|nr:hypothetical protein CRG98_014325 [Punica granatum]